MEDLFNITGKRIIWKRSTKDRVVYTTTISSKGNNGEMVRATMEVKFIKDIIVDNGQTINIRKGFLACYANPRMVLLNKKTNQKQVYNTIYIMVTEFDLVGKPIIPNFATREIK